VSDLPTAKKLAFAAVATSLALGFVAAAAETWLRVQHDAIEEITGVTSWEVGEWEGLTYHWDAYHPVLGWTNVPGYRSDRSVPFRVTINEQGLRSVREFAPAPPAGTSRVILLGDSCAFGEEVNDGQTVAAHLGRRLANTEILNFGVHGYGLGQMVLRLEEEGFAMAPDHVVVLLLVPGDLDRDVRAEFTHPKPVFGVDDAGALTIENVPVPEASRQSWLLRTSYVAAWLFGRPRITKEVERVSDVLKVSHALLARLARACDERGVALTVAPIVTAGPLMLMKEDGGETRKLLDLIRSSLKSREELDVLDLIPFLGALHDEHGGRLVAPKLHWTGPANCAIAERIAGHLADRAPDAFRAREKTPDCLGD